MTFNNNTNESKNSFSSFEWSDLEVAPEYGEKTNPIPNNRSFGNSASDRQDDEEYKTQILSKTESVSPDETQVVWNRKEFKQQPVIGWLVCTEGPDKGKDFPLHGAKCTIGRSGNGMTYSVSLSDPEISRKGAACVILYNEINNQFYLTPGDIAANINPYLNDEILLAPSLLQNRPKIQISKDVMIFVPFCVDDFKWNFESEEKNEN